MKLLFCLTVFSSLFPFQVSAAVYRAWIKPFGEDSQVRGTVTVFGNNHRAGVIAYYGSVEGVPPNLAAEDCTATNACGAHIHAGLSCESTDAQGGHYYEKDTVPVDPWIEARYSYGRRGSGVYRGLAVIGTDDLVGRAFVIHDETGARIGCGLLERISECGTRMQYMCPPFAEVRWSKQCLHSEQDCVCRDGFRKQGRKCVAQKCGDYVCPVNSVVKKGVSCLKSIRDCQCDSGHRRKGGYCVPVISEK